MMFRIYPVSNFCDQNIVMHIIVNQLEGVEDKEGCSYTECWAQVN